MIAETVRAGLEPELAKRGFQIALQSIVVDVSIRRFYNDFKTGFLAGDAVADFDATVTVLNASGMPAFSQSYFAQGVEKDIQLMTGDNARSALIKAMGEGVRKIVNDPALIEAVFHAAGPGPST